MWVYIPDISMSCPSAPAEPDWNWDLNSQCQQLAQSCTASGKLMPVKSWLRACKTKPWMMRLSSRTLPPLTANRGVERYLQSLPDIHASPSAPPGSEGELMTLVTSGPTSRALSAKSNPSGSSAKTFQDILPLDFAKSKENFDQWATALRQDSLRRQKLARRINVSDYSSWPTPRSSPNENRTTHHAPSHGVTHGKTLAGEAAMWPTPNVPNGGRVLSSEITLAKGATEQGKRQVGLENVARIWPTPTGSVAQDGESPETWLARREKLKETHQNGNGCGTPLTSAAVMWPNSADAAKPAQWALPTARDWKDGACQTAKVPTNGLLGRQSARFSLPAPTTSPDGNESSPPGPTSNLLSERDYAKIRRMLNPRFVEWLMGWPVAWTDFGSVETESYLFRQQQRLSILLRQWGIDWETSFDS
jgi:hypothetical protein